MALDAIYASRALKQLYSYCTQSKAWHAEVRTKKAERKAKKTEEAAKKIAFSVGSTTSAGSNSQIKTEPGKDGEAAVELFSY